MEIPQQAFLPKLILQNQRTTLAPTLQGSPASPQDRLRPGGVTRPESRRLRPEQAQPMTGRGRACRGRSLGGFKAGARRCSSRFSDLGCLRGSEFADYVCAASHHR